MDLSALGPGRRAGRAGSRPRARGRSSSPREQLLRTAWSGCRRRARAAGRGPSHGVRRLVAGGAGGDLATLYRQEARAAAGLAELPVQFADYAWEAAAAAGPGAGRAGGLLAAALAGFETARFPADRPRPLLASHAGAVRDRRLARWLLD